MLYLLFTGTHSCSAAMMVNCMCACGLAMGCPQTWEKVFLECLWKVPLEADSGWMGRLGKAVCPPQWAGILQLVHCRTEHEDRGWTDFICLALYHTTSAFCHLLRSLTSLAALFFSLSHLDFSTSTHLPWVSQLAVTDLRSLRFHHYFRHHFLQ